MLTAGLIAGAAMAIEPRAMQNRVKSETEVVNGRLAVAGEVLVKFRRALASDQRAQLGLDIDADRDRAIGAAGIRRIHSRRYGATALIALVRNRWDVEYAEPNYIIQANVVPNDSMFAAGQLWGLLNTGQTVFGTAGVPAADIRAPLAWDASTGSAANIVAVVDTGIDYGHEDLAANVWSAPAAFSVTIGGRTIQCGAGTHGFNAILGTCDPADDHGHGSHVAGTIGAVGNNGVGVVGVNWAGSIMGAKFLDAGGAGTIAGAIDAIEFVIQAAAANNANVRVISSSWGGGGFSQALLDQINKANASNMLFVASAGNSAPSGLNNDALPYYPASYEAPNIIAVAATDNSDKLASFSNFGATAVHLGAPGVNILSTMPGNRYQYLSGTSMAVPHVSGAAALVLSRCGLNTAALKDNLLDNVDPVAALAGLTATGGRLNVYNALLACSSAPMMDFSLSASPPAQSVTAGVATSYIVAVVSSGGFSGKVDLAVSGLPAGVVASFSPASVNGSGASTMTITPPATMPAGSFPLTITGASGSLVHSEVVSLTVVQPAAPLAVDNIVSSDGTGTRTISSFGTAAPGGTLIAFAASDGPIGASQTLTISGAGLTWTLVKRANAQAGSSEIWQATSASRLFDASVTSTPGIGGFHQSLTVVAFSGAAGAGGSAGKSAASGAPDVSVTTTRPGSVVYGVGNDWDNAIARVVGANQTMVHQWVDTQVGDTFWVQSRSAGLAPAGTPVQLNDTSPVTDRWNFAAVEIVPAGPAAPVTISNVATTDRTSSSATITWTTNVPASSTVEYGLTSNYGMSHGDSMAVVNHAVTLTGLSASTTYHYRVMSQDSGANMETSGAFFFSTTAASQISGTITAPLNGARIAGVVTVSADAASTAGISGVQFVLDGSNLGAEVTTLPYATAWNTTATADGSHTLTVIARDSTGNQAVSGPVTVTVSNAPPPPSGKCPCSIWGATATPARIETSDKAAVELGVQFRADVDGSITGLRFYKGPTNTGTHVGHLWSGTGTLLSTVTFTNETASGWQQATLPTPVAITAGATYVASYHTNVGQYALTEPYFTATVDNAPLHALADNGLYVYGGSAFPTETYNGSNYWVDVVFVDGR